MDEKSKKEKSREEILAERKLRKSEKQAKKTGSSKPQTESQPVAEKVTESKNIDNDPECGKSKSQLRAERRAKQVFNFYFIEL